MAKMTRVGFEPTPPKRVQLECTALDRSAIAPRIGTEHQTLTELWIAGKLSTRPR
eukprot:gene26263-29664_t